MAHLSSQSVLRPYALLLSLLFLFFSFIAVRAQTPAPDCTKYCYADTIQFTDTISASFSLYYIPCTAVVGGQVEQQLFTSYQCTDVSDGLIRVVFTTAEDDLPYYSLSWLYASGASNCASETLFADGFGTLLNATHEFAEIGQHLSIEQSAPGLADIAAQCGADSTPHCFSVPLLLNGTAGISSPCGAENTTNCGVQMRFTLTPSTGLIELFDVLVGADVWLSTFDPQQLESPELRCLENGQLQLNAAGVYLLWAPSDQPCDTLMNDLTVLATAPVTDALVIIGDEEWLTDADQGETSALANAACEESDVSAAFAPTYYVFPAWHPVAPQVHCSKRLSIGICCTVFGYKNRNFYPVYTTATANSNYFTAEPVNRGQTTFFAPNTTVTEAFRVFWDCDQYLTNILTWTIKHSAKRGDHNWSHAQVDSGTLVAKDTGRVWMRQARAIRVRNDCKPADVDQWCGIGK